MSEQDEVIQEFLVESYEGLDTLDRELVALEDDPANIARLASIFRTIHSLKGTSGFLGFSKLESIAHVGENLLSRLRDGELHLTRTIADGLLAMVDAIREILGNLEGDGNEGGGEYGALVGQLGALAAGQPAQEAGELAAPRSRPLSPRSRRVPETGRAASPPGPVSVQPASPLLGAGGADPLAPCSPASERAPAGGGWNAATPGAAQDELPCEVPTSVRSIPPVMAARNPAVQEASRFPVSTPAPDAHEDRSGPRDLNDEPRVESISPVLPSAAPVATQAQPHDNLLPSIPARPPSRPSLEPSAAEVLQTPVENGAADETGPTEEAAPRVDPAPVAAAGPPAGVTPVAEIQVREAQTSALEPARDFGAKGRSVPLDDHSSPHDLPSKGAAAAVRASGAPPAKNQPVAQENKQGGVADATVRVDVTLLDRLMNLVGELVLTRNQILQYSAAREDAAFTGTTQRLNLITTELQEGLMKTRMQPIGSVWTKFPRVIRDLSHMCGKNVRLEMSGEATEMDRTIIEAIKDPLTHIIRNAVDHGIETPEERRRRGKPEQGRLGLRAFHEGGKVNLEIADDGRGLDLVRIRQKGIQNGLITEDQAERMADKDVMMLIFAPGFSTAAAVTQVSGRGVGMDVVKTNIEKIGGKVEVTSRPNAGTTIRIKIPLTLAIIPALIVRCGGDSFAIPQVNLLELVRLEREQARTQIEHVHGAPVYRLRGHLLPLIRLSEVLGIEPKDEDGGAVSIVVLQSDDKQFGLVVDRVSDTEEIVVKPLGKELKGVGIYAGATIMGDGKVALILDVPGIAVAGRLATGERDRRIRHVGAGERSKQRKDRLLVFKINATDRIAIALRAVARLEEVPVSQIESAGGEEVLQYRGEIMPLIRLDKALGRPAAPERECVQVIVYSEKGRSVGLIVLGIEDVVEQDITVQREVSRPGILAEAVVQDRVTELLDLRAIVQANVPEFFKPEAAE